MSFGTRLKEVRKENGLSQMELGREVNVSGTTISQYESDLRFPDQTTLVNLCRALTVSADYLMGLTTSKVPSLERELTGLGFPEFSIDQVKTINYLMKAFKEMNMKPNSNEQSIYTTANKIEEEA